VSHPDVYQRRLMSAEEAVRRINSGDGVYIHSNAGAPRTLINAMTARADELKDVQIYQIITLGEASYADARYAGSFNVHSMFVGPNVRQAVNEGRADYTPVFFSDLPRLFYDSILPVDVCLIECSPPDSNGEMSYGLSMDCTPAAQKNARTVIVEINDQMPRTFGSPTINISQATCIVESSHAVPELPQETPGECEEAIGSHIASLVEDGATIQMGIGAIPNAVLEHLRDKRDLGVHSEMVSDGIIELIESGVINNSKKTVLPGKTAVSFMMGSQRLYRFVDNNPIFEFRPSEFINDPVVIAQNHKMTSINAALQIDLTGQVCADSLGTYMYSGCGGQVDFVRGARRSAGGKAIIALPSTAKNGTISRICPVLSAGAGVVTTRFDVEYVVTEYGIANLAGKNMKDRVKALIGIAHPDHRAMLADAAAQFKWLGPAVVSPS
jgi:acyl-CoA hydrolase